MVLQINQLKDFMLNTDSDFSNYFVLTLLADLFETSGSDDQNLIAEKIIQGLEKHDLLSCNEVDYEIRNDDIAA